MKFKFNFNYVCASIFVFLVTTSTFAGTNIAATQPIQAATQPIQATTQPIKGQPFLAATQPVPIPCKFNGNPATPGTQKIINGITTCCANIAAAVNGVEECNNEPLPPCKTEGALFTQISATYGTICTTQTCSNPNGTTNVGPYSDIETRTLQCTSGIWTNVPCPNGTYDTHTGPSCGPNKTIHCQGSPPFDVYTQAVIPAPAGGSSKSACH